MIYFAVRGFGETEQAVEVGFARELFGVPIRRIAADAQISNSKLME
jgi:hypothetical protein